MIIYKITNLINNRIYIGQTIKKIRARWRSHCYSKNTYIGRAINLYGKDNFKIEEIDKAYNIEELNQKEIYWISFYNSTYKKIGYNLASGGDRFIHSEESIKKMSISARARKMKPMTTEHKDNISKSNKGRKGNPMSEKAKRHLSILYKGKVPVKYHDTGKKISESKSGVLFSEEHKQKLKLAWIERKRKLPNEFELEYLKTGIKYCPMCKESKPIDDFFRKRKNEEDRECYCKLCTQKRKLAKGIKK
jgi:group I intron endonuclease